MQAKQKSTENSNLSTTKWQLYRNSTLGLTMEIPIGWKTQLSKSSSIYSIQFIPNNTKYPPVFIVVEQLNKIVNNEEYKKKAIRVLNNLSAQISIDSEKTIEIKNQKAIELIATQKGAVIQNTSGTSKIWMRLFVNGRLGYNIQFRDPSLPHFLEYLEFVKKMVDTLTVKEYKRPPLDKIYLSFCENQSSLEVKFPFEFQVLPKTKTPRTYSKTDLISSLLKNKVEVLRLQADDACGVGIYSIDETVNIADAASSLRDDLITLCKNENLKHKLEADVQQTKDGGYELRMLMMKGSTAEDFVSQRAILRLIKAGEKPYIVSAFCPMNQFTSLQDTFNFIITSISVNPNATKDVVQYVNKEKKFSLIVPQDWLCADSVVENGPILAFSHKNTAFSGLSPHQSNIVIRPSPKTSVAEIKKLVLKELSIPGKQSGGMLIVKIREQKDITVDGCEALQIIYSLTNNATLMMGHGSSTIEIVLMTVILKGKELITIKSTASSEQFNIHKKQFYALIDSIKFL